MIDSNGKERKLDFSADSFPHGGELAGRVLAALGVRFAFTLSGGHISPILVGCRNNGIRVIDVRHEVNAVFAADAVSRVSDSIGMAVLTAGPGLTNTITAVKNAQMAQSPLLIIGGATATLLKGRGSLQDIDQHALFRPHVKYQTTVKSVSNIPLDLEVAIFQARSGVPGPVFVEFPLDVLYPPAAMGEFTATLDERTDLAGRAMSWYVHRHVNQVLDRSGIRAPSVVSPPDYYAPKAKVRSLHHRLLNATRPVLILGSQAARPPLAFQVAEAVRLLGIPTYLSGMARGLLGRFSSVQLRHNRKSALKEADLVILCGVPFDFRLGYGQGVPQATSVVAVNLSEEEAIKNRTPTLSIIADPMKLILQLAELAHAHPLSDYKDWFQILRAREEKRDLQIGQQSQAKCVHDVYLNPLHLLSRVEEHLSPGAAIIADGGDFVATASYILRPRGALLLLSLPFIYIVSYYFYYFIDIGITYDIGS